MPVKSNFINRELSWLGFNHRVLQEAMDKNVPLFERLRFLGIFSSNQDEFFRVRVATIKRMSFVTKGFTAELAGYRPKMLMDAINHRVVELRDQFEDTFNQIITELQKNKVFFINENQLTKEQKVFVRDYFHEKVRSDLIPVMLNQVKSFPELKDQEIYFAVIMKEIGNGNSYKHALIEIPKKLPRFVQLPSKEDKTAIILLDDIIRFNLEHIFKTLSVEDFHAYTIKVTRDAELELDNDVSLSLLDKVSVSVKQRAQGDPVRFIYDKEMPDSFLKLILKGMKYRRNDSLIPGGRYHNFKDFIGIPDFGRTDLIYPQLKPLNHPGIDNAGSIMKRMREGDFMVHYPYQRFDYFIDLLREAAIDPLVSSIRITLYRVASNSKVTSALINAAKNGKNVVVVIELQARFDEENNIYWANKLREENVRVIFGVQGYKVHAKLCLITRKENGKTTYFANIGTGNFNENTARIYGDKGLFTTNQKIAYEVKQIFNFFENNLRKYNFQHLFVSPYTNRSNFIKLINREIRFAKAGKEASILLKMNNLVDQQMINKLYQASKAGVKIRLIIRGICALKPGVPGLSENIKAIGLIDRFLEHARVYVFHNGGDNSIYISSADWMTRNLDFRIEVSCPVYDQTVKKEIMDILEIQWKDNVKARIHSAELNNEYRRRRGEELAIRSQYSTYDYLTNLLQ